MRNTKLVYVAPVLLSAAVLMMAGCTFIKDLFNPVTDMGEVPWTEVATYLADKPNIRFSFSFPPALSLPPK